MKELQHKPGSKPYRRELREQLKALGFPADRINDAVATALAQLCHMRPRTARRLACELSLDEVAARYSALRNDAESRMRGSRIWDFEQWPARGVHPTVRTLRTLADIYGTSWVQLVDIEDLRHMPEEDRELYHRRLAGDAGPQQPPASRPRTAGTATAGCPGHPGPPDPAHRPLRLRETGTAELMAVSGENALGTARHVTTTNVDDVTVEQLDRELRDAGRAYLHASPAPVLLQLTQLGERMAELLRGQQRPSQTIRLQALAARCSALTAWVCDDLGGTSAARAHLWAASMFAGQAEHDDARRWVSVVRSRLAFSDGDFVESARIADDGARGEWPDGIKSHLLLRRARALARAGQDDEAREALRAWEEGNRKQMYFGTGNGADGIFHLQSAQQRYFVGAALLDVRDIHPALQELLTALDLFDKAPAEVRAYAEHALSRIDTARAFLTLGEPSEAHEVMEPVFALPPERRSRCVLTAMNELLLVAGGDSLFGRRFAAEWGMRADPYASRAPAPQGRAAGTSVPTCA
ncbi:hypothetical protein ACIQXD_16930 [Streptomyces uncialis]|uniref:hypothetical protein n=1 Tax=Streptomyces uncialis TaxID=1048205 RepID=UPI003822948B